MAGSATVRTAESRKTMLEPRTAATRVHVLLVTWRSYNRPVAQIVSFARPLRAARLDVELGIAVDAARRAGRLQMERYERLERIVHKSEHDVVTEVDTLSEQLIINAIRDTFPHDSIL